MEEPKDIVDADADTEFSLGAFPNPPLDECPIIFLGKHGGRVVFAMPDGDIRDERAGDIGRLIATDIYNCIEGRAFMTHWRDKDQKFQRDLAVVWFVRHCRDAGYWDASRAQRSLGVWPDDGQLVLHCGDKLWTYPRDPSQPPVSRSVAEALRGSSGPLYRLNAPRPAPKTPASVKDGQWVREQLDLWRFEEIGDDGLTGADLLAGWLMASLLGAGSPFRPHLLLYSLAGSGKTTLIRFVHGLLSALSGDVIDSFSPAGFRSDLGGMARPVIIDEAEATPGSIDKGPVEQALELIRRMATGEGAVRKMGAVDGKSVTQTAVGSVLMAAVNPVRLGPADSSRIAEARLQPLNAPRPYGDPRKMATDEDLETAIAAAKDLAPHLLGRALTFHRRYLDEIRSLKASFGRQGLSPRTADLIATLAAGRRLLMSDDVLTDEKADEEARFWSGLLAQREQVGNVSNPGQDCLAHLFNAPSGVHLHDRVISIGEVVRKTCGRRDFNDDLSHYADVLKEFGLKLVDPRGDDGEKHWWLLIANQHPALERIFDRTPWRDWRRTLPYLDALGDAYKTEPAKKAHRFGMIQSRALCIPLDPWIELGTPSQGASQ